jgi:hypothetical protein
MNIGSWRVQRLYVTHDSRENGIFIVPNTVWTLNAEPNGEGFNKFSGKMNIYK